MDGDITYKPSHAEWIDWAKVVVHRLTTCVHVYSKPPHEDVFIAEKERQDKNAVALSLLHRIHGLIDKCATPTESLADVAHHDEQVIDGLVILMKEFMGILPILSADMQKLLKSHWYDKCSGRVASELFRGPMGDFHKGIGSGFPEQGRLPEALANLIERERIGDCRQPRKELHRHGDSAEPEIAFEDGSHRPVPDARRRWAD